MSVTRRAASPPLPAVSATRTPREKGPRNHDRTASSMEDDDSRRRPRRRRARPWAASGSVSAAHRVCGLALAGCCCAALPLGAAAAGPSHRGLADDPLDGVDVLAVLRDIGKIDCPGAVAASVRAFLAGNEATIDACNSDAAYTLLPFGGVLPDAEQTAALCASPTCMDVVSGVVLAKLPECEVERYSPRSLAESLLRVRVDLANNRRAPTATEFGTLYALNRVVNYLTENATIRASMPPNATFDATAVAARMNPLQINKDVVLSADMKVYRTTTDSTAASSAAGSENAAHSGGSATATSPPMLGSVESTGSRNGTATLDDGEELPGDLGMAYLYVGFMWLVANAVYWWVMTRKVYNE